MDKNAYENYLKRKKKGKKPPIACSVCGEDNKNVIEMHHVEGRNNSDWVKPLCKNCHSKITSEQNRLSPKVRSSETTLQNKRAFNIISIGGLLRELGQQPINLGIGMAENV